MPIFTFCLTQIIFVPLVAGQHIHDDHPVYLHGGGYHRSSLEGAGHSTPIVKLDDSGLYMIFNEWLINSTCKKVERGNTYSRSVLHKVHVGVEGEVEWGAEAGAKILAAELKTYSKARVQLNGGWSGEWKEELSFSSKTELDPCQKVWYVFLKNRTRASGSVYTWEHKITCIHGKTGKSAVTYCNRKKLEGTGVGWGTHLGEHVQRGLVDPCPCSNIDPDTTHVFDPTVPVPVPDPNPDDSDTDDEETAPPPKEEEPEWILQNPLKKTTSEQ